MRRMRRIYTVSVQYLSYTQTDKVLALTEEALILIGFGGMCLMQLEMCMCKRKALVLCRRHFRFPHDEAQRTYAVSTYWRHDKDLKGCLPFLSIFLPFFLSSSVIHDFFPTVKLFALLSDTTNRHPSDLLFHAIVALFPLARLFAPRPCCKRYAIVSSGIFATQIQNGERKYICARTYFILASLTVQSRFDWAEGEQKQGVQWTVHHVGNIELSAVRNFWGGTAVDDIRHTFLGSSI